jgi:ABC-type multidrug transport system, ATPase component
MISASHLCKQYGNHRACSDISFEVFPGEVTALLGPNGAGKSTLLKMLAGVLRPSSGSVSITSHDIGTEPLAARRHTGCVFENAPLYGDLTVGEHLAFVAGMYGYSGEKLRSAISRTLAVCCLDSVSDAPVRTLSRGFRQRAGLALALVHDPDVLILDEPTSGLDPVQLAEFRSIVGSISSGKTILLSTHSMGEVESLCGRILMLSQGKLVGQGTIAELCRQTGAADIGEAFIRIVREQSGEIFIDGR